MAQHCGERGGLLGDIDEHLDGGSNVLNVQIQTMVAFLRHIEERPPKTDSGRPGCTNNDTQHTQAHDDVSLMLATFDTPTYLPNRCR